MDLTDGGWCYESGQVYQPGGRDDLVIVKQAYYPKVKCPACGKVVQTRRALAGDVSYWQIPRHKTLKQG